MTLRRAFRPLRPDLDEFLFATVGDEIDGVPLSVISMLIRLGLDPWEEAGRLSSLNKPEAIEQLAQLVAELPSLPRPLGEAREIAEGLVPLLPERDPGARSTQQVESRPGFCRQILTLLKRSQLWVACIVVAAAALASALMHGGLPFGI